jgi:hypothetical protein
MEQVLQAYDQARREKSGDLREIAQRIVEQYPEAFTAFAGMSLDTCVGMVSGYRQAGRSLEAIAASVWVQATFGPQRIVGAARIGG